MKLFKILGLTLGLFCCTTLGRASAFEGYGAGAQFGSNLYYVTSLANSGPGTLRDAVSVGNRYIVFAVTGDITLTSEIHVKGSKITIDGIASGVPITLHNHGIIIRGTEGANNVIIKGLRIRDAAIDGIQIANSAYNVVIDQTSITLSGDGQIDVTEGAHDVTISNSFLVGDKITLIKYGQARNVSMHHNFMLGNQRLPQARIDDTITGITNDVIVDVRNNIIVQVTPPTLQGSIVWYGPLANIVNNLYIGPRAKDALVVINAAVYASGNRMYVGTGNPNVFGTWPSPFPVPFVTTQDACVGAGIAANAGVPYPDDAIETSIWQWLGSYIGSLPVGQGC